MQNFAPVFSSLPHLVHVAIFILFFRLVNIALSPATSSKNENACMGIDIKKSVGLILVTRLTIRGSVLPIGVERATQKPHAEYDKIHRLARVPTHD